MDFLFLFCLYRFLVGDSYLVCVCVSVCLLFTFKTDASESDANANVYGRSGAGFRYYPTGDKTTFNFFYRLRSWLAFG